MRKAIFVFVIALTFSACYGQRKLNKGLILGGGDTITNLIILNDTTMQVVVNDTTWNMSMERVITDPWPGAMAASYISINDHATFTPTDQAIMTSRLSETYVVNTYGPTGLDKSVADFFLYFKNTNDSTALTTRTVTKSGDSLIMWDYGDTTYYQNDLPAHVNNGVVTATSYDGFNGVTNLRLNVNSFDGPLFDVAYYMPALTDMRVNSNAFDDSIPDLPNTLTAIYINNNEFDSHLPYISDMSGLRWFHVYRNDDITGTIDSIPYDLFREMQSFEMDITGLNLTDYSSDMRSFRVQENRIPSTDLETAMGNLNTFFTSHAPNGDCIIDFTGPWNGYIEDTATSTDYQALDDIWKAEGLSLTFSSNVHPGPLDTAAVVFTFDDGLKTVLDAAEPLFSQYDIDGTSYITIDYVDNSTSYGDSGMTWTEINELQDSGWTIGSHGYDHVSFALLDAAELNLQVEGIIDSFAVHGYTDSLHFCYPFGAYDDQSQDTLRDNFISARIVDDYYAGTSTDPFLFPGVELENAVNDDIEHYKKYVDFAFDNNTAVIFLSHAVYGDCDTVDHDNCLELGLIEEVIQYVQAKDPMNILTIEELYNRLE